MTPSGPAAQASLSLQSAVLDEAAVNRRFRWGVWVMAAALMPAALIEARAALTRPFWNDEVYTATVASLASSAAIWRALADGLDTMPPLFYIVTGLGRYVTEDVHLAYRLPALLGFLCATLCVFLFVERRMGSLTGFLAGLLVVLSGFQVYATEARPYGFVMGCFAVALLSWQRLERSRAYAVAFALSTAALVASHYYAVLAVPAFVVGEAVRWYRTKQLRYSVWIGLLAALAPLAIAWPLIGVVRSIYGGHFWAKSSLRAVTLAYTNLTGLGAFTIGVVIGLGAVMLVRAFLPKERRAASGDDALRPEEAALALYLICLPLATHIAATLAHGGLVLRYVLPTLFGLVIAAAFGVAQLGRRATLVLLAVLLITYANGLLNRAAFVFRGQSSSVVENSSLPVLEQMLQETASSDPVVVSAGNDYVPLAYYARAEVRDRLVTLVDIPAAIRAVNSDSVERAGLILRRYLPLRVEEFSTFRASHRRFLLFSTGSSFDWWPQRLLRDGHSLTLQQARGNYRLYQVELLN